MKRRLFQWVELGGRQECGNLFGAVVGEEPLFDEGVYVVELRDFDEEGWHGWGAAGDEFEIADGGEQGGATAGTLSVLPTFPLLETKGGKEAGEAVKFSAWRARRGDRADKRDSLNHRFDCIVWEYGTRLLLLLAGLRCRGERPVNYETLLCEVKDQIGRVTLNRPEVLHALNAKVFNELEHAFMTMTGNVAVRVILLTGAGEKAFAAGADINEIARLDVATGEAKARRGTRDLSNDRDLREAGDCGDQWVCAGGRVRVGDGLHDSSGKRDGKAGTAGGEAGADSGLWRDATAAAAGGAVDGAEVVADGGDDWGGGGTADWAGG